MNILLAILMALPIQILMPSHNTTVDGVVLVSGYGRGPVEISVGGYSWQPARGTRGWLHALDTRLYLNGQYAIYARHIGQRSYASVTVTVNNAPCGIGSWQYGRLEVHHINIGQGDSTFIVSPTGKTLLFDAGESYWNSSNDARKIGAYIQSVLGCKKLDYVVISHFHVDHIGYVGYGGLWHLVEVQGFTVGQTLHRDYDSYLGSTSGTFNNWKVYLEGSGRSKLNPSIATTGRIPLGNSASANIIALDGNGQLRRGNFSNDQAPPSENDYGIGLLVEYGNFQEWIGGDLSGRYYHSSYGYRYHDIETSTSANIGDVDVLRVNHHGSGKSTNATFVGQLDPTVSIISVGDANTYGHPAPGVLNRLLITSDIYLTERGSAPVGTGQVVGDIVLASYAGVTYTVAGTVYTATNPIRVDADGDGFFFEVDPDDTDAGVVPAPAGGCRGPYQIC